MNRIKWLNHEGSWKLLEWDWGGWDGQGGWGDQGGWLWWGSKAYLSQVAPSEALFSKHPLL